MHGSWDWEDLEHDTGILSPSAHSNVVEGLVSTHVTEQGWGMNLSFIRAHSHWRLTHSHRKPWCPDHLLKAPLHHEFWRRLSSPSRGLEFSFSTSHTGLLYKATNSTRTLPGTEQTPIRCPWKESINADHWGFLPTPTRHRQLNVLIRILTGLGLWHIWALEQLKK